ncbi:MULTISPECIES: ABC transporter permease [Cohnella]|uniref:ABC transporter permease n=1 Tax=Cohnella TaxID=329857 RepID=UPI0009BBCFF1|nr:MULTISPECIES: ABC transporter permease [Cohnella]MBN2983519.1 ABC transporter permease [Cohnella algarum]
MNVRALWRNKSWTAGLIGCLIFALLWQIAAMASGPDFLPAPARVIGTFIEMLGTREFLLTVLASYERVFAGWAIGGLLGVVLGILMGRYKPLSQFFYSPIQFFRVIPSVALVPILVIWLGIGEAIKIIIIAYGVLLVVAVSISDAVHRVSASRLRAAQSMGAGPLRLFWGVLIPSVMPEILKGVRGALAFAFMSIVGIEMLAAQNGIGQLIWNARVLHETETALSGILALGLMGITADFAVRTVFRLTARRFMLRG